MRHQAIALAALVATALATPQEAAAQGVVKGYPFQPVTFTHVKFTPHSLMADRLQAAREVTVPLAFSKCESEGRYRNFVWAANPSADRDVSTFMGFPFDDTDVYKTIEGASFLLHSYPDERRVAYIDSVLTLVEAAQEPDGYLYTARTINPLKPHAWSGTHRWEKTEEGSHELYNLGHLLEAAVAHYEATGSKKMLHIAQRYADCVIRAIGPAHNQLHIVPGHQIAEMALAKLYLATGEKKYLDEAKYFLDMRGRTAHRDRYSQSDIPVTEQREAWGHAVRAGYMYAGMADVAALTGDNDYINAIDEIWRNIVSRKYYLTGGVGARHDGEAFGADYELPNLTAYNETCAAIAQCYLNLRLFLLHGEAKYIDCLERSLYNGVLPCMSIDGGKFFYPNPLESDGVYKFNSEGTTTRQPWFGCACCPSNLSRFIPSLPGYIYAQQGRKVYVNLYNASTADMTVEGRKVSLTQETTYPMGGKVSVVVGENKAGMFTLKLRIPGWLRGEVVPSDLYSFADGKQQQWAITLNGKALRATVGQDGYVEIDRKWKKGDRVELSFDMDARFVKANNAVEADRGRVAVERGPLVYCAEWADNAGRDIAATTVSTTETLSFDPTYAITNTEGDGRQATVGALTMSKSGLRLIPYYAWNHRGAGRMMVWLKAK